MRIIAVLFCGALAACSQTGNPASGPTGKQADSRKSAASKGMSQKPAALQVSSSTRCQEAVAKAQQQSTNAAMLGSALSMAGGLGGFGGRGGAIAGHAVSMGSSVMQAKARTDTQNAVQQECLS